MQENKMDGRKKWLWFLSFVLLLNIVNSVELTFELVDNAKDCFYEIIKKNTSVTLEFQVVTGGSYDVDVTLLAPNKDIIYRKLKSQYDSHNFLAPMDGEYAACFSNEFSTFSHKLVYMDFQVGDEAPLPGISEHATALTQMEMSADTIHRSLNYISDHQTHYKLHEAQGRKRAEDLNETVLWWAVIETFVIITVGIGQVFILKNFFSETKPRATQYTLLRNH